MQKSATGPYPEKKVEYPGKQPSLVAMQAAKVWHAFKNGGFREERVPYAVLEKMASHQKTFEFNFRKLGDERKGEFKKFFWASANGRGNGDAFTQKMADAVAIMRDNEPKKAVPTPAAEPPMVTC
ncbi:MAG: hypothetical protein WC861_02745 [Candidatus Micrarchaeia archaeon]|jgi:hypothetical protein